MLVDGLNLPNDPVSIDYPCRPYGVNERTRTVGLIYIILLFGDRLIFITNKIFGFTLNSKNRSIFIME